MARTIQLPDSNDPHELETEVEAIFRSAPMTLVQFYVTIELARDVVWCLGDIGNVHFRDLNSKLTQFQRTFMNELRDIDNTESQLKHIYASMLKYRTIKNEITMDVERELPTSSEMDFIKAKVAEFHEKIQHLNKSYDDLDLQKLQFLENRYVVNAITNFHRSSLTSAPANDYNFEIDDSDDEEALLNLHRNLSLELGLSELPVDLGADDPLGADLGTDLDLLLQHANFDESGFNTLAGTIERDKVPILRKILWRTLRGNLYFQDLPIDERFPRFSTKISNSIAELELVDKNIFIIYIHGEYLRERVRKIIQSLDGFIYNNVQGHQSSRDATLGELNYKIEDLVNIVLSTKDHLIAELMIFQQSYSKYYYAIQREKLIYTTLNKFDEDSTRRCLVGEGWVPETDFNKVKTKLKDLVNLKTRSTTPEPVNQYVPDQDSSLIAVVNRLSTTRTAPTFHKTNKFTSAFQLIIDAYGIATYQEVNPGLATIITFPFMFAIMFGDMGHGFVVFLIAIYLIWNERPFSEMKNKDEIFEMAFTGRYIVLLMGVFSMYTGFIYNDVFSKSFSLFSSGWDWEWPNDYDFSKDGPLTLTAKKIVGKTYAFGLDWAWHGTDNNLLFTNSYKMKLSILMGFIHMNYSFFFSLVNYRFFNSSVDIIGNFIPGFLFMQSIFGYLTLTILYKWSVDWLGTGKQPPGLLNMLINMFLAPTKIEDKLYPGQQFVQIVLVLISLVCVPWLLAYKPYVLYKRNKNAKKLGYTDLHSQQNHELQLLEEEEAIELNTEPALEVEFLGDDEFRFPNDIEPLSHNSASHGDDHDSFNFGDVLIHQVIHTIEFCLNCVSHTASYLRLWALSLAHAQLSTVLWTMTIQNAFGATGAKGTFMTVVLFGLWFTLSICILVLMEGTSAMLHSLRLHWVEAMSKFFEGEGYAYEPFTFDVIEI